MLRQAVFANAARSLRPAASRAPAAAAKTFLGSSAQLGARAPLAASIPQVPTARWYSAEASKEESKTEEESGKEDVASIELKTKLEAKEKEAIDLKDKYLRTLAEFRTLQDRTVRDKKAARDFAIQKFASDLCDSVDNLDRALAGVPHEKLTTMEQKSEHLQDLANLYQGLKLTESMLLRTMQDHGVERFDPHGEKFNANEHEVTMMIPHPEHEDNTIMHVERKGFKLNGRLLRAAKVQVAKNLKKATE